MAHGLACVDEDVLADVFHRLDLVSLVQVASCCKRWFAFTLRSKRFMAEYRALHPEGAPCLCDYNSDGEPQGWILGVSSKFVKMGTALPRITPSANPLSDRYQFSPATGLVYRSLRCRVEPQTDEAMELLGSFNTEGYRSSSWETRLEVYGIGSMQWQLLRSHRDFLDGDWKLASASASEELFYSNKGISFLGPDGCFVRKALPASDVWLSVVSADMVLYRTGEGVISSCDLRLRRGPRPLVEMVLFQDVVAAGIVVVNRRGRPLVLRQRDGGGLEVQDLDAQNTKLIAISTDLRRVKAELNWVLCPHGSELRACNVDNGSVLRVASSSRRLFLVDLIALVESKCSSK